MITSLQNPKIKNAIKLRNRRDRDQSGLFLIEGFRELTRAVAGGQKIQELYFCSELFLGTNEQALIESIGATHADLYPCNKQVFEKLSYRDRPDGLLGIGPQTPLKLENLKGSKKNPLYIVAEAIEKPGNLGTILRSSDAVGLDGLIVCDACTDLFNPNVVRASVGTLFTVPVATATTKETIQWLKKEKVKILAATPHATDTYTNVDLSGPIAIAVGTEQYGLSDQWMDQADIQVKIPMLGVADSLNVATATTVLLYEALRQRT